MTDRRGPLTGHVAYMAFSNHVLCLADSELAFAVAAIFPPSQHIRCTQQVERKWSPLPAPCLCPPPQVKLGKAPQRPTPPPAPRARPSPSTPAAAQRPTTTPPPTTPTTAAAAAVANVTHAVRFLLVLLVVFVYTLFSLTRDMAAAIFGLQTAQLSEQQATGGTAPAAQVRHTPV